MTRRLTRNYSLSVVAAFIAVGLRSGSAKLTAAAIRGALKLAVLFALLLLTARPAQAQSETVLYNFTYGSDGAYPSARLTSDGAGNFYGTTGGGALGYGTVFELSPNGSGGWNETTLHTFTGGLDGSDPWSSDVIFDRAGNLYGTAYQGGANGAGVVFELSRVGSSWTETVLYSFCSEGYPCNLTGGYPTSGVIMDPGGNLYGTTSGGGGLPGAVFELSPSGGGWTEQVIYTFDIGSMYARVTMDAAGNIFGITNETIFELSPNGNGVWTPTVIHTFTRAAQGYGATLVLGQAGNLYGTTAWGNGTVYELSEGGSGWTQKILYYFKGGTKGDGSRPFAGIVFDTAGNIYGTTSEGGEHGAGTVFELVALVGKGTYAEKVLWSFNGTDGTGPAGSLILDSAGNLYGTTGGGGSSGVGVVYEVTGVPAATATTLTSLPNPSTYGQAVTFTALLTPAPPDGESVSFKKGTAALGTGLLRSGSASFTTSTLPVGTSAVTAAYAGDSGFYGSTSNTLRQVVKKAPATTTLTSSPNPSSYGQPVIFTAAVTSAIGTPPDGENVTFKKGTTVLGTSTLSGGAASFTTSTLPVGTDYIKAVYAGDTNLATSTSNPVKQAVQ